MAILSGIITGVLAQTSFLADTIFTDITVTYEWWVLFAMLIIVNQKHWIQAALKVLGFFLISQTLVFVVEWLLVKEFYFSYWYRWIEIVLWTAPDALLVWLGYINQEGILGDVIQALPIRLLCFVGSHIVSFLFKIRLFICLRSCFVQALFWFYVLREKSIDCWLCCVFTILLVVTACFVLP
ncbi:hypothetical protein [Faecalicoccus pleomorphus]|uniref:hypothetical protein n=1 Tax=Faecalicoccus pleomorphus TaxID=1323 RepID=UPI0022E7D15E|nr:hypothetical protein [Faecalicoccus pleomorphus]